MGQDITVLSAKFLKNAGKGDFLDTGGEEYEELNIKDYEADPQIILRVEFQAVEHVKGKMFISVRRGEEVIAETDLRELELHGGVTPKLEYIRDIKFPGSGLYEFDIVFRAELLPSPRIALSLSS